VVVLLSDGDNNWQGPNDVLPGSRHNELLYGAYGRLADNRLPITPSTSSISTTMARADAALDARTAALCTAMKAAPYNITIYV
uniref:hypothetical protein n=1 Tax=Klebsiella pneumoniae TaxID=573 RepID=UPI00190F7A5C